MILKAEKLTEEKYEEYKRLREAVTTAESVAGDARHNLKTFMGEELIRIAGKKKSDPSELPLDYLTDKRILTIVEGGIAVVTV